MRSKFKFTSLRLAITFILLSLLHSNKIHAQTFLPLADSLGTWSASVSRAMTEQGSPMIEVSTNVIKHYGTTGVIEVKIINRSESSISGTFGLKNTTGDINDNTIHINNSYQLTNLKPNYSVTYKMELRECLPKGARKMDDLQKIKACQPRLLFIGK